MGDNSASDLPSSQQNNSSPPSVGCLANQRPSCPQWSFGGKCSNSSLSKLPFFQISISLISIFPSFHFYKFPFFQIYIFLKFPFFQDTIFTNVPFFKFTFVLFSLFPYFHFSKFPFFQIYIFPNFYFSKFPFLVAEQLYKH